MKKNILLVIAVAMNDYLDCCSDAKRFYNLCLK